MQHSSRIARRIGALRLFLSTLVSLVGLLAVAPQAHAIVSGTRPQPFQTFRVFGDYEAIGNTMMANLATAPLVNSVLLSSTFADISETPADATVEAAYLFWTGSQDPDTGTDTAVNLTLPNGTSRSVRADQCRTLRIDVGTGDLVSFFYCRADVSALLAANPAPGGGANGRYTVSGLTALPGELDGAGQCILQTCQAFYAAWSMVFVWSSENESTLRDVVLFDGFQALDETTASAGIDTYSISGFNVANPPDARFTFFGLEGDAVLGVPPQDLDPVLTCTTCFDYLSFNGTKLSNASNQPNNVFNSSIPTGVAIGVDIDTFDVSSLVAAGATSARIEVGSGDGNTATGQANGAGGGELFFIGYNVLGINRLAPNFRTDATRKSVDPTSAAPGEILFYSIDVQNDGSLPGTNVVVRDSIPANTTYVAGSTRVDDVAVADVGGTSALVAGLNLGTIPVVGDNSRRITFRVRVNDSVANGTLITNNATITAAELTESTTTNTVTTTITAPALQTPTKAFIDLNGGEIEPGDAITYTVTLRKSATQAVSGLTFEDDISPFLQLITVSAGGFTDGSLLNGGANGTGLVRITSISSPSGSDRVTLSFTVRVKDVDGLIAAGAPAAGIDGLLVSNQGRVLASFLAEPKLTDDPTTAAAVDPTVFALSASVNFTNAATFKSLTDLNGGQAEPGDPIQFVISIRNDGSQPADVDLTDDLPANISGAALAAPVTGVTLRPAPAGANRTGRLEAFGLTVEADQTIVVRINATIAASAPNGASIRNLARLEVPDFTEESQDLQSEELIVRSGPDFSDLTKVAGGGVGGFEPGATVTFTISGSNQGVTAGSNVVLTDVVDSRFTAITPADGGVYDPGTRTITWNLGSVALGATFSVSFTARIAVTVPNGTSISNQAQVTARDVATPFLSDDPGTAAADDPTIIRVQALPAVSVEKTVLDLNGGSFEPGDVVRYSIRVQNAGRAAATSVAVTDPLPTATFTDIAVSAGGTVSGGSVTWNGATTPALLTLDAGEIVTLTIDARILDAVTDGTLVSNQARFTGSPGSLDVLSDDPTTAAVGDPTTFTINAVAVLSIAEKTALDENGGAPQPGDAIVWTIRLGNSGSGPARDVVITDVVDTNLADIDASPLGLFDAATRTITWTLPTIIEAGAEQSVSFRSTIAAGLASGTVISNQARIESPDLVAPVVTDDPATPVVGDATELTVESRPDFATSTKEVASLSSDGEFRPGSEVVYTILVSNTGTEDASNVVVTDLVDTSSLTDVSVDETGTFDGTTASWTIPSLRVGEQARLAIRATIVFPLPDATIVSNQASIAAGGVDAAVTDDPATPETGDATLFTVNSRADLSSSIKTFSDVNGAPAEPGDVIEYVVVVLNTGTAAATDVVIRDVIDANLTAIDAGRGVFDEASRTITWDPVSVPELASVATGDAGAVELRFSGTIAAPLDSGTAISNQATLVAGGETFVTDDPTTAAESDPTRFQVISGLDLSSAIKLVSAPGPRGYRPGDQVIYTLRVANTGNAVARNVVVTDPLDTNLLFVSADNGGTLVGRSVRWTGTTTPALASLAPGATVDLQFVARIVSPIANGTTIPNQAQVTADGVAAPFVTDDPTTDEADDTTAIVATSSPTLNNVQKSVTDVDGDGVFEPGDEVLYTITILNEGDGPATNVTVRDPLPLAALDSVSALDNGTFDGTNIVWNAARTPSLASVAPGAAASARVRFRARIRPTATDGTLVSNQGFVAADGVTEVRTDDARNGLGDDDATTFAVVAQPRLDGATKQVVDLNGGVVEEGDLLEYTITARNDGTETAVSAVVRDPVPAQLTNVTVTGGSFDGAAVVWNIGDLAPAASVSVRFRATVRPGLANGTRVANQATVTATGLSPEVTDDPATAVADDPTVVVVNAFGDLSTSEKSFEDLNGGFIEPGDLVRYEIRVRNTGSADAERVVVTDRLPPELVAGAEPEQGGLIAGGVVTWNAATTPDLDRVTAATDVVLSVVVRVPDTAVNGDVLSNQASVVDATGTTVLTDDPSTPAADDPTLVTVFYPDLGSATKTVTDLDGETLEPGDRVSYEIRFGAGSGPSLTNVLVTDAIDAALTDVVADQGGVFDAATGILTWSAATTPELATVLPGTELRLSFTAQVRGEARDGDLISNQALLTSDELLRGALTDDPATEELDDATIIRVTEPRISDLSATTKEAADLNGGLLLPGDLLRYTITVPNAGPGRSRATRLLDTTPDLTALVPGSLSVDGTPRPELEATLASGIELAEIAVGAQSTVVFDVTIAADAPTGAVISNSALLTDETGVVWRSDDPGTDEVDDPTSRVVGESADLSRTIKAFTIIDDNGNGLADVGEGIRYVIGLINRGSATATGVVLDDLLPANVTYRAGTLRLDTVPLSDALDGDRGSVVEGAVRVDVGEIAAGDTRGIEFDVTIDAGPSVVNQGLITWSGGVELTDDDGNPANGDSATVVVVGANDSLGTLNKTVADANGGTVEAGDTLVYTVTYTASGSAKEPVPVVDATSGPVTLTSVLAQDLDVVVTLGTPDTSIALPAVGSGEERVVVFEARVSEDASVGDVVCNTLTGDLLVLPDPVCVTVGGRVGVAEASGRVFWEPGEVNGSFDGEDEPLPGFVVELAPRPGSPGARRTAVVGEDGSFDFGALPPGDYEVRVFGPGGREADAAAFSREDAALVSGASRTGDIDIEPMGIVYNAETLASVGGARVSLYYDERDPDGTLAGQLVDPTLLGVGQQGQLLPPNGFYTFTPPKGHSYRIEVDATAASLVFPSTKIPEASETLQVDQKVVVSSAGRPAEVPEAERTYHTVLAWNSDAASVTRNHLPLDPLSTRIELTKRADRVATYVGGIVTYTVRVLNRSTAAVAFDPALRQGGAFVVDALPASFRLVDGSPHWSLRRADGRVEAFAPAAVDGERRVTFGRRTVDGGLAPFDLPAGAELELKYQLVVGSSTEPGRRYRNLAQLRSADGDVALSNEDNADVRVDYDPIFDQGVLLGKVYCDLDGDGRQQQGETGLWSARVFLDSGHYVDTDREGRFHFGEIDPGLHLVKLDTGTLPPGSAMTTDERRLFNVTRGTPSVINFGVACTENWVSEVSVEPGEQTRQRAEDMRRARFFDFEGSADPASVWIDGQEVPFVEASMTLSLGASRTPDATAAATRPGDVPVLRWDDTMLATPIVANITAEASVTRWVFEVADIESGLVVWQESRDGAPPARVEWDGTDGRGNTLVVPRRAYEARLRVFEGSRRVTEAAPKPFLVAGRAVRYLVDQRYNGVMPTDGQLPEALIEQIQAVRSRLTSTAPQPIRVEVHVDDEPDRDDEQAQTASAAQAVARYLTSELRIPRNRVRAEGFGSSRPQYPNFSDRPREINRRILIRVQDPTPAPVDVSLPRRNAPTPSIAANQRVLATGPAATFSGELPRPADGLVVVRVAGGDGSVRTAMVRVRDDAAAGSASRVSFAQVPVEVDLDAGTARVGSSAVQLEGLSMRLTTARQTATQSGMRVEPAFEMAVEGAPRGIRSWRLEVVDEFGDPVFTQSADGAPPDRLRWSGNANAAGAIASAGEYEVRLLARMSNGGLVATPALRLGVFEARVAASARVVSAPEARRAEVRVNAKALPGRTKGSTTVASATGRVVWIDALSASGSRVLTPVTVPTGFAPVVEGVIPLNPFVLEARAPGAGADDEGSGYLEEPADLFVPGPAPAGTVVPTSPVEPAPAPAPSPAPSPAPPPVSDDPFGPATGPGTSLLVAPPSLPSFTLTPGRLHPQLAEPDLTGPPPAYDELAGFYAGVLDVALESESGADLAVLLADAPAGDIEVDLPGEGLRIDSDRIALRGRTAVGNTLTINGLEVELRDDGTFDAVVPVPPGQSELVVEATDIDGNVGRITWPIESAATRFFVLALGDSAIGTRDAQVAGSNEDNSLVTDGGVSLYGQARVYLKGWVRGSDILGGMFDRIDVTAHADTGKRPEYQSFVDEVIDPERSYPIYGDSSDPVSDVNARGKLYALVEAGNSRAVVGNFRAGIKGLEFFSYDRSLYGGQVVFNEATGDQLHTEIRAHVADDDSSLSHAYNFLRGTGGSIYYLQNRAVLEGSERISLVVRDRASGLEIARIPQSRNADYTIRYSEGRIVFKRPIPSLVDDSTALGGYQTTRSTLAGHPLYVEVAYDHEGSSTPGDLSYGAQARETIADWVTLGGGVVEENRASGPNYKLWSVQAGVGPTDSTRLDFEYAASESQDAGSAYSDDGGLRFSPFRLIQGTDDDGEAVMVRGRFELADVIESESSKLWGTEAYYSNQGRGFFSNGTILSQGETKAGVASTWLLNDRNRLGFRYDNVLSRVEDLTTITSLDTVEISRTSATGQYEYTVDRVGIQLGYQHNLNEDPRLSVAGSTDVAKAGIAFRLGDRLRLGVEQEVIVAGNDTRLIRGADVSSETRFDDRFISSLSAGYQLTQSTELTATERFRYSGENSTLLGMRSEVGDDSTVYVQQRLTSYRDNHGAASSTVVGGEQRFGEDGRGRAYTEYQAESGVSAARDRALIGLARTWQVTDRLSLDVGYERSQTAVTQANESEHTRDAASLGWTWAQPERLSIRGTAEARWESGPMGYQGANPCLGGDLDGNPSLCRDATSALGDRRQLAFMNTAVWNIDRDWTLFGRFDLETTENTTLRREESRDMQTGVGAAFRPADTDWLNILFKYTYLEEVAPYGLELGERTRESSHVTSFSPVFELPWNLQLVEKGAWRHIRLDVENLPVAENDLVLWVNRLNYHLSKKWDAGVEYRFLHQTLTGDWQHGTLLELNYILAEYVRLGLGYNFTRFAEDELGDFDRDSSGVFFRVSAQY